MRRSSSASAALAIVLVGVLILGACTVAPDPSPKPPPEPGEQPLAWSACPQDAELRCATLVVPMDHADPQGPTFALPVVKIPAGQPGQRLGSLVLHRGGPGFSVLDYVRRIRAGELPDPLRPAVYERYDVIAVDQRGAGQSEPAVRCFATDEEAAELAREVPAIPLGEAERGARIEANAAFAQGCREQSGQVLEHVSTEQAARDLDLLRVALGEARLNFLGQSYGSFFGTVYANLFPDRVGRFVFDSIVDPAQVQGPPGTLRSARLGSDVGSAETFAEFLRLCAAGGERCPFGAGDPATAWERLSEQLRTAPVQLTAPDGRTIRLGYSEVVSWTGNWLYQPVLWDQPIAGAAFLAAAEQALDDPTGETATTLAETMVSLRDDGGLLTAPYPGAVNATAFAVNCLENQHPDGPEAYLAASTSGRPPCPTSGRYADGPTASVRSGRPGPNPAPEPATAAPGTPRPTNRCSS